MSDRVGYWVDMENPYITYDDNYIESVWWSLKEIDKKRIAWGVFRDRRPDLYTSLIKLDDSKK